jgi:hypothetical protein
MGKKVTLTPKNIIQKTAVEPEKFIRPPKKIGLQRVNPPKIPKTAPRDKT